MLKDKYQIILSGVGGQGLIACGSLLAEAAIIYEGRYATLSSSYGVETRGTFTKSDVIISGKEIFYPEVMKEDMVLSLAQVAYDRYVNKIDSDACLIYDSGLVTRIRESKAKQYGFPFTDLARELGNITVANVIAIGTIIKLSSILSQESVLNAIKDKYKEKTKVMEFNTTALKKGLEIAASI